MQRIADCPSSVQSPENSPARRLQAADLHELAEAILTLGPETTVMVVAQGELDPCEACAYLADSTHPDDPEQRNDGAFVVVHQAHDSKWPHRETVCTGCLIRVVDEYDPARYRVWVEVPATPATRGHRAADERPVTGPLPVIPAQRGPLAVVR